MCVAHPARALDPNRPMSQYTRDQWGVEQGFPGGAVYAIAETGDGYLWFAAEQGLVRFDGLNFRLFNHATTPVLPAGPMLGLVADAEANLWIRPQTPGLVRYIDREFRDASPGAVRGDRGVTAMCRGANGEVLLAGQAGNLKYNGGKLTPLDFGPAWLNLLVISVAATADGKIWLGTRDTGLFSASSQGTTVISGGLPDKKINALLPVGDHELWIGTDNGLVRWNGSELTQAGLSHPLDRTAVLTMARDHESNIWVGSATGLVRVNAKGASFMEDRSSAGGAINALFEDREGDLWVGNAGGVERIRDNVFSTYFAPGVRSGNSSPVYVDSENRTWFAPSTGGLYWLRGDAIEPVKAAGLDRDVVYSIAGGPGELWVGRQRGALTRLQSRGNTLQPETYTRANGLAENSVYTVHRNRDGTVWAGTLSSGATRFANGRSTTYTTANGLASNTVSAIEEDSSGVMWFATPSGLSALSNGHWRTYTGQDGLPPGTVNCLLADSAGVLWIGTSEGLAFLASGTIRIPRDVPQSLQEPVFGIAADQSGWLWIATANHVLRVNREKLLAAALGDADVREFGLADGLLSTSGVKRSLSVVADPLGRIWFSLNRGLSVVDPARAAGRSVPAPIHIQAISADGRSVELRAPVRVPPARQRFTFNYIGLSLSAPDRVRYRYRLDGFDHAWSEITAAREAVYTNLGPGPYRFRVMARNPDGVWNSAETDLKFEIEPVFWQTWWFRLSALIAFILTIVAVHRFRLHQLTRQLNVRFEERLSERTRIAQDLHDTLLQGFLSASMQLHVAVDSLPADSSAKPLLGRVLELMGQVVEEGRNAVRGLRSAQSGALDLEQAFSRVQQELGIKQEVDLRILVDGHARPLHPVLRDEVYRIGREALVNAFRHSRATSIELELEYGAERFRLLIRDNGFGIDPQVLQTGREGHWGLSGMRERAERIGARLRVWSSASAGTEVELTVPSHIAFQTPPSNRLPRWLAKNRSRRSAAVTSETGVQKPQP